MFYVPTSRQLRRLESITRSPVYSWFGESVHGVSTIKAFGMVEAFSGHMRRKIDTNGKTMMPNFTATWWLNTGIQFLGNIIILFASLLAILNRQTCQRCLMMFEERFCLNIYSEKQVVSTQT